MVNTNKLIRKMMEMGYNTESLSKRMQIPCKQLVKKLKNPNEFVLYDAYALTEILKIPFFELEKYFFI